MRFVNRRASLFENVYDPVDRQLILFGKNVCERAAVKVFHHQIGDAVVIDGGESEICNVYYIGMA